MILNVTKWTAIDILERKSLDNLWKWHYRHLLTIISPVVFKIKRSSFQSHPQNTFLSKWFVKYFANMRIVNFYGVLKLVVEALLAVLTLYFYGNHLTEV